MATRSNLVGLLGNLRCVGGPDVQTFCTSQAKRLSQGGAQDGDTIFVSVDCGTREPTGEQDPVFKKPGVALPRAARISALNNWLGSAPEEGDSCNVKWDVLFDSFDIRGKEWPSQGLGIMGAGLEQQLKGCGTLTDWHFEWTQYDSSGFEWHATGRLPIGTKACVGRAVMTAGGENASKDKCHGAG